MMYRSAAAGQSLDGPASTTTFTTISSITTTTIDRKPHCTQQGCRQSLMDHLASHVLVKAGLCVVTVCVVQVSYRPK